MKTSAFVRANRGHKGIDSGYRATKGENKRQLRRLNRRIGRNLICVEMDEIANEAAVESAEWDRAIDLDEFLTYHSGIE